MLSQYGGKFNIDVQVEFQLVPMKNIFSHNYWHGASL